MDKSSLDRIQKAALENIVDEVSAILQMIEVTGSFDVHRVAETKRKLAEYKKIAGLK